MNISITIIIILFHKNFTKYVQESQIVNSMNTDYMNMNESLMNTD